MKKHLMNITLYQIVMVLLKLLLLLFASIVIIVLFMLPNVLVIFQPSYAPRSSLLSPPPQTIPLSTIEPSATAPSNGSTSSSQNSQEQQVISEAQNDVTIANTIITFTGVFVGIVTAIVVIAGFFGISEFFKIRELRTKLESEIEGINDKAKQTKDQIDKLNKDFEKIEIFEKKLGDLTQSATELESKSQGSEQRLRQLSQDFDDKRFLDTSHYFGLATNAYDIGDNAGAIEYYKLALKLQPDNIRVMERLGRAYSNLEDMENAEKYLEDAHKIAPENVPVLRSLALYYRYTNKPKAIEYLKSCTKIDASDHEAWDFLGLLYRDQKLIGEAIAAHEEALKIKERPETQFYLSILLLYSPNGDKTHAKSLMISAYKSTLEREHDLRIRPVWKILIHAGIPILDGKKEEALKLLQTLTLYITTQRIHEALKGHLEFLLEGTGHKEWIPEFMDIVKFKEM